MLDQDIDEYIASRKNQGKQFPSLHGDKLNQDDASSDGDDVSVKDEGGFRQPELLAGFVKKITSSNDSNQ